MRSTYCLLCLGLLAGLGCRHGIESNSLQPAVLRHEDLLNASEDFVFQADPPVISLGQATVLRWNIRGASNIAIEEASDGGKLRPLGKFSGSGTLRVSPQGDSTYVISCEGNATVSCASVSVRVRGARH
jgi:hypothetical protein